VTTESIKYMCNNSENIPEDLINLSQELTDTHLKDLLLTPIPAIPHTPKPALCCRRKP